VISTLTHKGIYTLPVGTFPNQIVIALKPQG
jgi:hypothetical protein